MLWWFNNLYQSRVTFRFVQSCFFYVNQILFREFFKNQSFQNCDSIEIFEIFQDNNKILIFLEKEDVFEFHGFRLKTFEFFKHFDIFLFIKIYYSHFNYNSIDTTKKLKL